MYMDKELMEVKLYQIIDKFNKRKIRFTKSHLIVLNKMQPFIMKETIEPVRYCLLMVI